MSRRSVRPGVAAGAVVAPPSKSYTHRGLVAGYWTRRDHWLENPLGAVDTRASRAAVQSLGRRVRVGRRSWLLTSREDRRPGKGRRPVVRCRESGTTLRLFSAVAALKSCPVRFEGSPALAGRPIEPLWSALESLGARVRRTTRAGALPAEILGPIRAGTVTLPSDVSSQFVSALLLALPCLDGESRLVLTGTRVSAPYIEATLATMGAHGVSVEPANGGFRIPGAQEFRARRFRVPGDASSAAYLWAAAAASGGEVAVDGVGTDLPQADRVILPLLRRTGCRVHETGRRAAVAGPAAEGFDADLTDCPDLFPLVGALAAIVPRTSRLRGAAHVRFKESDRRAGTVRLARSLGASVRVRPEEIEIRGTTRPQPLRLAGETDHRMVMSAAVAALAASSASLFEDADCVRKSFPGFWDTLRRLGVRTEPSP